MPARIRTLKPETHSHRKTGPLPDRDFRLFVGLITLADDEGRFVADPEQVRVLVFGYHPKVRRADVETALRRLAALGLVVLYQVGGTCHGWLPSWKDHQKISHPTASKLPAPDEASGVLQSSPEDSGALTEGSGLARARGSGSGSGRDQDLDLDRKGKDQEAHAPVPPGFTRFWEIYPSKVGRDAPLKKWQEKGCEPIADAVIAGLEATRAYLMRESGRFIPNPATWLNQGRWQDEPRANGRDPRHVNADWEQPAEGVAT